MGFVLLVFRLVCFGFSVALKDGLLVICGLVAFLCDLYVSGFYVLDDLVVLFIGLVVSVCAWSAFLG